MKELPDLSHYVRRANDFASKSAADTLTNDDFTEALDIYEAVRNIQKIMGETEDVPQEVLATCRAALGYLDFMFKRESRALNLG